MNGKGERGFTLVELLAVISILALLLAVLFPSLRHARRLARTMICASRLSTIGQAHAAYESQAQLSSKTARVSPATWTRTLLPLAGNEVLVFTCPEGEFSPEELEEWAGLHPAEEPEPEPQRYDLSTLVAGAHGRNRWTGVIEDTDYPLEPDLPPGRENRTLNWQVFESDDTGFTIALEDSWQDTGPNSDYNDLVLRFDYQDVVVRVTYVSEGTGSFIYTLKYADGQEILGNMGQTSLELGTTAEIQGILPAGEGGGTGGFGGSGGFGSYGMNSLADRIHGRRGSVLVLDYHKRLADCAGPDATDIWEESVAPRHTGRCNVLFDDGSVAAKHPAEIDPTTSAGQDIWGVHMTP